MIDLERCIGCKSCEAACKLEHGLGPGEYRNRVVWLGDTRAPALDFLTLACQHCARPACLRACPVNPKAIEKDAATGVVRVIEHRCTGCGECVIACPYGAMGYDAAGHHAVKCDLCADRRAAGQTPACAAVCPGRAIRFGDRDEHVRAAQAEGRSIRDFDDFLLDPATVYLDRIDARRAAFGDAGASPGTELADRLRPAVIDDPAARGRGGRGAVAYPYRRDRADRTADRVVPGGCNICFNTCSTNYHLRDGRLARVTGNESDPLSGGRICPKSQLLVQLHNNDQRLTRPLKRVGERGEGRFEPVSWAHALDEIAAKLAAVRDRHGPEALGIFAGTRTGILAKKGYIALFAQMWGTPNVGDTEPFCSASKNLAFRLVQGRAGSGSRIGSGGDEQLHRSRHRQRRALPLRRRQPGGDAARALRHGQRLAHSPRRPHGGRGPASLGHREPGRPVAPHPQRHRPGPRARDRPPHLRAGARGPEVLRGVGPRLAGVARVPRGEGLHARVGGADHRNRRPGHPHAGRRHRDRRRLRHLREPRRQPARQRHPDQPRADVRGGHHRQLGKAGRRLLQHVDVAADPRPRSGGRPSRGPPSVTIPPAGCAP